MDIVDQLLITKQDLGQNMKGLQSDLKFNDRKQEHQSAIQLEILIKKLQHILKGDYLSSNNNIIDTQLLFQDTVKNVQECQKTFQVVDNNIKVSSNIQQLYQKLNNYPIKISKQTQKQEVQLTQQILRIYDLFEQVEKMRQKIFIDEQQFSPEIILEDFDEIKLMESSVHNQE
uniref:Uncharacterized protein n=2 Tax=Spironucleus salmonicida TaxID=348837 RepID=V6LKM9_9EUKA|eukprot:EST45132.1 Hypothetical protein SS50377_15154 [Spironucleus salmonicida]